MMTEPDAKEFARDWIAAWNAHDLEKIMSHYVPDVVLISPVAAKVLGDPSGKVTGQAALRNYFKKGLDAFPNLQFELLDVMFGLSSVVLVYINQRGTKSAEFMEFGGGGKVARVVANYSA
jgi:ketosteroid isomerase-like protein